MSAFAKGVLSLSSGNIVAQLISIVAVPIITRLYSPAEYGLYAVFLSLTMILYPISTLLYHPAVMLPDSDEQALSVVKLSLLAVLCTSLLILVVSIAIWLFDKNFISLGNYGRFEVLFFLPLSVALHGVLLVVVQWLIRKKAFNIVSIARIFASVADRSGTILLSFFHCGVFGLILGRVFGPLISLLFIIKKKWLVGKQMGGDTSKESSFFTGIGDVALRYKDFPRYSIVSTLSIAFSRELPIFLLASFFPSVITGLYALGVRIVNMPMMAVGDSISFVFFQKISEMRANGDDLHNIVIRLLESLLCLIVPAMLFLIIFGGELFAIIFGKEWIEAGKYVGALGFAFMAMFVHRPLATIYDAFEKQRSRLIFSTILVVVRGGAMIIAFGIHNSPIFIVRALAVATLVVYSGSLFYLLRVVGLDLLLVANKVLKKFCLLIPSITGFYLIKYVFSEKLILSLILSGLLLMMQYLIIIIADSYLREVLKKRVFGKCFNLK